MEGPRIVSLIASATEIVCALGYGENLVGRSHECDFPASVAELPVCTSPKFDVHGSSREIDERVKSIVQDALSVYRVDANLLDELKPTHIITQSQCEVCAVSLRDVEEAVCLTTGSKPIIVSLEPNALADIWADIRRVASALGDPIRGDQLVMKLKARIESITEKVGRMAAHTGLGATPVAERLSVACIEWIDPLMAAGNWMPELVELAGGINLFGEAGKHSPWMTWQQVVEADPGLIFVSPCGFDIERTMQEMNLLTGRPEWGNLKAVRTGRVMVADGNQYFNRPGPRIVESLEILAEALHPGIFHFGHEDAIRPA
ncbi:MAG TPA: cobalamin-binding protein [Blastocatellia bacterium]|nr:cobalamin-binding protein [Blastocatellia bacterium]